MMLACLPELLLLMPSTTLSRCCQLTSNLLLAGLMDGDRYYLWHRVVACWSALLNAHKCSLVFSHSLLPCAWKFDIKIVAQADSVYLLCTMCPLLPLSLMTPVFFCNASLKCCGIFCAYKQPFCKVGVIVL